MLSRVFLSFTCLLLLAASAAQDAQHPPLATVSDARRLADSAMELVVGEKVGAAFDELKIYWPLPPAEIDGISLKTVAMRDTVAGRFGKSIGYAFVREDKVGDFLIRYIYAEKREHHVLRWVFVFYRPGATWVLNSVSWDDTIQALF